MRDDQRRLIDEAIDDTARALTESQPHAALRTNIATRIAGHQSSPWRLAWSVGGAVAAVVILVVLMWPAITDVDRNVGSEDTLTRGAIVPPEESTPVRRALSGSPGEPDRVRPTTEILQDELVGSTEPIVVEPLELNALALDTIEIPMLAVEALTVEPLTPQ